MQSTRPYHTKIRQHLSISTRFITATYYNRSLLPPSSFLRFSTALAAGQTWSSCCPASAGLGGLGNQTKISRVTAV